MKRYLKMGSILFSWAFMMMVSNVTFAQALQFSQQFDQGVTYHSGQSQYDDWLSFRASLPESGVNSITVKGSEDPVGRTCSDPEKAQLIADAMRVGAPGMSNGTVTLSLTCDGFLWNAGACSASFRDENGLELNVGSSESVCNCNMTNYVVRPGILNLNWGGIAGLACGAPSQTLTVEVELEGSAVQNVDIDIKPGNDSNSINLCSRGTVPLAILGSDTFDPSNIVTDTLRFAEASVKMVGKKDPYSLCGFEDVNGDYIDDLVCHFMTTNIAGIDGEVTYATLSAELVDGTVIEGSDTVNIVKHACGYQGRI